MILGILASSGGGASTAYESIATTTITSNTSFTLSSIPSTYTHLQLRINMVKTAAGANEIFMRFNGDTATNYASHKMTGTGSTINASGATSRTSIYALAGFSGAITTYSNVAVIDILDYANTTKNKTSRSLNGGDQNAASSYIEVDSGLWLNTAAITSITIFSTSTFTSGSIALYGIKAA